MMNEKYFNFVDTIEFILGEKKTRNRVSAGPHCESESSMKLYFMF